MTAPLAFRKSSYSAQGQECAEVAPLPRSGAALRDSKHPEAGHLSFGPAEWRAFLTALKHEEH